MSAYLDHNRRAWDARAKKKQRFTRPANDDDVRTAEDSASQWYDGNLAEKEVLCLAAGGGRQSALYAALGANVTVVDISPEMLAIDRQVAAERKLPITTVEASMDNLSGLPVGRFDIVIQPVSTCYVPDVEVVYRQVARIIRPGGVYVSQHKQPASLQTEITPGRAGYELTEPYVRSGPLPPVAGSLHREEGTLEYLHRLDQLLGGLCRTGFVLEDVTEPQHADLNEPPGTFAHRSAYVPPYIRIRARRTEAGESQGSGSPVIVTGR